MIIGDSKRLITASADQEVMLWELETGVRLHTYEFSGPARYISFSEGEKFFLVSVDPFMGTKASIEIYGIDLNAEERTSHFSLISFNYSAFCSE